MILGAMLIFTTGSALAHQSPGSCNSNSLTLSIARDELTVQQGDTITYTITASNFDTGLLVACDTNSADVIVTLPAMDGTPTGSQVTIATGASYPAGTPVTTIGTVPYVVNVNAGVTDVVVEVRSNGTLHDAPVDHAAQVIKTLGTAVVSSPGSGSNPPGSSSGGSSSSPNNQTGSQIAQGSLPRLPNAGSVQPK